MFVPLQRKRNRITGKPAMRFIDMMANMDLKQMESFVRIAELGGFSRAATLLDVAQSSLSRQIRQLEVELRQNLFYRTGRGVELTESGKLFFEHARALVASAARARSELSEFGKDPTGRIVIGLPPRLARHCTVPLVRAFQRRFPRASICVVEALSTELQNWLMLGRIELGLLFGASASPTMEFETIYREEFVLAGHVRGQIKIPASIAFSELSRYPLMLPQMPNATRALLEGICKRTKTQLTTRVEIDTVQAILELVCLNEGYGVLPLSVVRKSRNRDLRFGRIRSPELWSTLVLANARQRPITKLAAQTKALVHSLNLPALVGVAAPRPSSDRAQN